MKTETLRCLSIRQPWAWAICANVNDVENRTWTTDYRGTIAIHASTSKQDLNALIKECADNDLDASQFSRGAIIGLADIVDVREYDESFEENRAASGPYCWKMQNGRFLRRPIPLKGKLNLFSLPAEVAQQALSQPAHQVDIEANEKLAAWADAVAQPPDPVVPYLQKAEFFASKGDLERALKACERAVDLARDNATALGLRGAVLYQMGDDERALADLNRALKLEPEYAALYVPRGEIYFLRGELDNALADYDTAIELDADDPIPYVGRAAVLTKRGDYANAVVECDRSIALAADDPVAFVRRGEAYLLLGNVKNALADCNRAIGRDPQLADAYSIRAAVFHQLGDADQACADLKTAADLELGAAVD